MEIELGKFNLHTQKGVNSDQLGLGSSRGGKSLCFIWEKLCLFFKTKLYELMCPVFQLAWIDK